MSSNNHQNGTHEVVTAKRDLKSWWKSFTSRERKPEEKAAVPAIPVAPAAAPAPTSSSNPGIFGVPLQQSIKYANVAISLLDATGKSFTYGYVPIVVAKCGVFLKEKATEVEGIFRLGGAERRIKELQATFNSPDKYGKGLDWTGYTVHDAANVLRRYFNKLPEPVIPYDFYERFRDPIRGHQEQAVGDMGDQQFPSSGEFDAQSAIKTYQQLITEIPPLNRQLLLYVLDLLAVFASKSDINHMNAPNLSIIFQPGILSHPDHYLKPEEYRLSQDILIFLIDNQDHFLVGMQGTAADEKTIQEVQAGGAAHRPAASVGSAGSHQRSYLGRSASNASAAAESLRRFGGVRRNVSTNSRRSHQSNNTPSPVTPPPESPFSRSGGVYRSNTVPSKKSQSPSMGPSRIESQKSVKDASPGITGVAIAGIQQQSGPTHPPVQEPLVQNTEPPAPTSTHSKAEPSPRQRPTQARDKDPERLSPHLRPIKDKRAPSADRQLRMDLPPSLMGSSSQSPSRERPLSSYFGHRSSSADPNKEGRKPNKLQKRRPEGAPGLGTKTSNPSLSGASHPPSPAQAAYAWSPRQTHSDSKHAEPPTESIDQMTDAAGQHSDNV